MNNFEEKKFNFFFGGEFFFPSTSAWISFQAITAHDNDDDHGPQEAEASQWASHITGRKSDRVRVVPHLPQARYRDGGRETHDQEGCHECDMQALVQSGH